jgi:hypothetical protein
MFSGVTPVTFPGNCGVEMWPNGPNGIAPGGLGVASFLFISAWAANPPN